MDTQQYDVMADVEDRHWWYRGMQAIAASFLGVPTGQLRVLDAGCGTGGTTRWLRRYGRIVGVDYTDLALRHARDRHLPELAQGSVVQLPFAAGSFDLVTSFDVLYHRAVGSDDAALRELARVLRPHGRLLIRLPAYDWLRGAHDAAVHTERRYTASGLRRKLAEAGFDVRRISYANSTLFPLALAKRLTERSGQTGVADLTIPPGAVNDTLRRILEAEARWLQARTLPAGLSVFALAERVY